ncbi:hypothetical protein ACIPJQ_19785 [Streptomyces griseoviridis]
MTTTPVTQPARVTPASAALGFLTSGVVAASLTALVVGVVLERVPLILSGLCAPVVYGLLYLLAGAPRRAREAAIPPATALAVIESLEAVGGESGDVPVRFVLTVAPDDAPAYRVETRQDINLVDLPDYRPGGVLVVQYPTQRPWRVRIVKRPTPEWEERAAGARIDSVPGPALVRDPSPTRAPCLVVLLGLVCGAAAVLMPFRADLSDAGSAEPSAAPPSVSSTTSSTVVSSSSGTVTLGPGQSFLDEGELSRAVDGLTGDGGSHDALTVVVQERLLTVVFAPPGSRAPGFDPRSLPAARVPTLVEEATGTLGVRTARTWQVVVDGAGGSVRIRVLVSGSEGTASLEADGDGHVVRRTRAG